MIEIPNFPPGFLDAWAAANQGEWDAEKSRKRKIQSDRSRELRAECRCRICGKYKRHWQLLTSSEEMEMKRYCRKIDRTNWKREISGMSALEILCPPCTINRAKELLCLLENQTLLQTLKSSIRVASRNAAR